MASKSVKPATGLLPVPPQQEEHGQENGTQEQTEQQEDAATSSTTASPPPPPPPVLHVETDNEQDLYDLISNLDDTQEVLLDIPEWKVVRDGQARVVQVLVRAMTAEERISFLKVMQQSNVDLAKLYPDIAILCARHPVTKKQIWKTPDRGMLLKKHGFALERIAMCAAQISGLSQEALEQLRKN